MINLSAVCKVVSSLALKLSIGEISFVVIAIELKSAFTSFFAFDEISFVLDGAVVPCLSSLAMVDIIVPLSLVHGAIGVDESTLAIGFSTFPLALVDVSVGVGHATFSFEETGFCLTLEHGAVGELDGAETLPNGFVFVFGPVRKNVLMKL